MPTTPTLDAAALRAEFDAEFARPPRPPAPETLDLLRVRTGGHPLAMRLSEVAGLHADLRPVPYASALREFVGLVGIRGSLLPVYDLAVILNGEPPQPRRWIVVARAMSPVGFAFDELDGHARVAATSVLSDAATDAKSRYLRAFVHLPEGACPVLSVPSIVEEISRRCAETNPSKERQDHVDVR